MAAKKRKARVPAPAKLPTAKAKALTAPPRPKGVPPRASYAPAVERWIDGENGTDSKRNGVWTTWNSRGEMVSRSEYEAGKETRSDVFETPLEGTVANLVLSRRFAEAAACARDLVVRTEEDLLVGAWFLRALESEDALVTEDGRVHIARAMLEVRPRPSWGIHTRAGQKRYEARIKALETLARDARRRGTDLDQALQWADEATQLVHHYGHTDPFVTKAKILDLLGRTEEAYAIARYVLEINPNVRGFDEFHARPEFARWMTASAADGMTLDVALRILGTSGSELRSLLTSIADEDAPVSNENRSPAPFVGPAAAPELRAYAAYFESIPLRRARSLEFLRFEPMSFAEALDRRSQLSEARFRSMFLASTPIAQSADEIYLASWWSDEHGHSPVHQFRAGQRRIARKSASIASFVARVVSNRDSFFPPPVVPTRTLNRFRSAARCIDDAAAPPPAHVDPLLLDERLDWLVALFFGKGKSTKAVLGAPSQRDWLTERRFVHEWPHLHAYWCLHHAIFDNRDALAELARISSHDAYAPSHDLRQVARSVLKDELVTIPGWESGHVLAVRLGAFEQRAPVFEAASFERLEAGAEAVTASA